MPIHPKAILRSLLWPLATIASLADLDHRKSDLTVQVQSIGGQPLENATIEVQMLNHAFRFGCSTQHRFIDPNSNQYNPTVVANLQRYFNSMTYGNFMKWTYFEARTDAENVELVTLPQSYHAFNSSDPLRVRGHVTIWGSAYQVPDRVKNSSEPDYIHQQILDHVHAYHATFKNAGVDNFDLHNEPLHERELLIEKIVASGEVADEAAIIADWFKKAKEADPNAILFINDYNILNANWVANHGAAKEYKALIDAIRDAGGPIDGIGVQAHMSHITTRENLEARLAILAEPMAPTDNYPQGLPSLPIEITEYDINESDGSPSDQDQATQTRDLLTAAFENPSVNGVTIWGMNDSNHWRGNAIMFNDSDPENWVVKPSGQEWIDLVMAHWWTDENGVSNNQGEYQTPVFKGKHRIRVTYNGVTQEYIQDITKAATVEASFATNHQEASTYPEWKNFIPWNLPSDSDKTADPDGDKRSNLAEYLLGSDPNSLDNLPSDYVTANAPGDLSYHYSHRAESENLNVEIEYADDLLRWLSYPDEVLPPPSADPEPILTTTSNGVSTFKVQMIPEGFYRLKIAEVP
ncbi:MAG: endo-1,4-beta-xylanase [Verrucomicrobiota bacterium]